VRTVRLPRWDAAYGALDTIFVAEMWQSHHRLLDVDGVGEFVRDGLRAGQAVTAHRLRTALAMREAWRAELAAVLADVDVLALPTLVAPPPPLTGYAGFPLTALTAAFNLAGVPALAMPVPPPVRQPGQPVPVSLQLVGPPGGEGLLCATGLTLERLR
jgi:amidase